MDKRRGVRLPGVRVWRLSHRYQPEAARGHSEPRNFFLSPRFRAPRERSRPALHR